MSGHTDSGSTAPGFLIRYSAREMLAVQVFSPVVPLSMSVRDSSRVALAIPGQIDGDRTSDDFQRYVT